MNVVWIRSLGDNITFHLPSSFLTFGVRGSGKSSLLEEIAEQYLKRGSNILDLYGSRDGEGLGWLRNPLIANKKVLLLHGSNTSVACSYDTKAISDYKLEDLNKYDLIISAGPMYSSPDVEYSEINTVIDSIYLRRTYKRLGFIVIREAGNLLYSRLKVSPDQTMAKKKMIYFCNESRHSGFAIGIDAQKLTSVDLEVRNATDFIFLKSLGILGLPKDWRFLYGIFEPLRLQNMRPKEFVCMTARGSIGYGQFKEVPWHKKPKEDILRLTGIEVEHGSELIRTKTRAQVGDLEHADFITKRLDGLSLRDIAQDKWSSSTICTHIDTHNKDIARLTECKRCTRAKSPHNRTIIDPEAS